MRIPTGFATPDGVSSPMHLLLILWLALCAFGAALSMRSVAKLGAASPLTRLGWFFTLAYCAIAAVDAARSLAAPAHVDDVALVLMALAFVVAGIRDEPQAEPWYWPERAGLTGRERRARP
jgi:hypothetical protein